MLILMAFTSALQFGVAFGRAVKQYKTHLSFLIGLILGWVIGGAL